MKNKAIHVKPIQATTVVKGDFAKAVLKDVNRPAALSAVKRNENALSLLNKLRG